MSGDSRPSVIDVRSELADPAFVQALGLVSLEHRESVDSTMDLAHALAEQGAAPGTLVLADRQLAGRGRSGRHWTSEPGAGLWMTLIERPVDSHAIGVLALRLGMALAAALDAFSDAPIGLKWPNDLYVRGGKLAGILVEARWRESMVEWVAIGVGLNTAVPEGIAQAASVRAGVSRTSLLEAMIPAMRSAAAASGPLTRAELDTWARRDIARGRPLLEPRAGTAIGLSPNGALIVQESGGRTTEVHSGSLVFA